MRPEEPQSYRDLGLTYREMKKYDKAIKYLYKVVTRVWDGRFSDIDLIALYEMNAITLNVKNRNGYYRTLENGFSYQTNVFYTDNDEVLVQYSTYANTNVDIEISRTNSCEY